MAPVGTLTPGRRTAEALGPTSLRPKEHEVSVPDKFEMVSAVVLETGCSDPEATAFVEWLTAKVKATPEGSERKHRFSDADYAHHDLFSQVMPDEAISRSGSAHATIEHGLGVRIRHTMSSDRCAVAVEVCKSP